MLTAAQVKDLLGLRPLTMEGGYFAETYRASELIGLPGLPERYSSPKAFATAIYYLLTEDTFSAIHRLPSDELYHFYLGDPVELLQLSPEGSGTITLLGPDLVGGMRPQACVPRGVWQGSRLRPGGIFALLGTTVAPGFDYSDFEAGDRRQLLRAYPDIRDLIVALTRSE